MGFLPTQSHIFLLMLATILVLYRFELKNKSWNKHRHINEYTNGPIINPRQMDVHFLTNTVTNSAKQVATKCVENIITYL